MDEKVEPFYQIRAKEIIDMLFDKGYFREDVSRNGMDEVENFLAWTLKVQCDMAVRCALLVKGMKK